MDAVDTMCVIKGDITELAVTAVVNAANEALAGGGGVDGAIHRAAGPELASACQKIGGCPTGAACLTPGFHLKAPYIIHTVGPVWSGGQKNEDALLQSCYLECLRIASEYNMESIAFPCISTGVYGFPFVRARDIAIATVHAELLRRHSSLIVYFVCYSESDYQAYREVLSDG